MVSITDALSEPHHVQFVKKSFVQNILELRAQMMSASLLSDMESFKAANPNGKIEDFIRWYSPRDWIEDDQGNDPRSILFWLIEIKNPFFRHGIERKEGAIEFKNAHSWQHMANGLEQC